VAITVNLTRGLVVRFAGVCVGIVALAILFRIVNIAPDLENSILLFYVLMIGCYLGFYSTRHADEIFPE
jgi:hypothetical protein